MCTKDEYKYIYKYESGKCQLSGIQEYMGMDEGNGYEDRHWSNAERKNVHG
jgi:hypothetical protein